MHNNLWSTLYFTLVPAVLFFAISIILRLTKRRFVNFFVIIGIGLLFFPILFIVGHFVSMYKEMSSREGIYIVVRQEKLTTLCGDKRFDTLKLTLKKNGNFEFNYKPCFADKTFGHWEWTDNMVHSYSIFDKLNDSLELDFPSEFDVDTIVLTNYHTRFLTFARVK
jgi:hypothetical protein